jgi:hypothetical protein
MRGWVIWVPLAIFAAIALFFNGLPVGGADPDTQAPAGDCCPMFDARWYEEDEGEAEPEAPGETTFERSPGRVLLRDQAPRAAALDLPGSFGDLSIEVTVRIRADRASRAYASLSCIGPGQSTIKTFVVSLPDGAYAIREEDETFRFEFAEGQVDRMSSTFRFQVRCAADEFEDMAGTTNFLPYVSLGVDGRVVADDFAITSSDPKPWDRVAARVNPRGAAVLSNLVVRGS